MIPITQAIQEAMARQTTQTKSKNFDMDLDLFNQWERARVDARELGIEGFPGTLKDFLNQGARELLDRLQGQITMAQKRKSKK